MRDIQKMKEEDLVVKRLFPVGKIKEDFINRYGYT